MANSLFEEKLNSNGFLVTTEVGPPKGTDIEEMIRNIDLLLYDKWFSRPSH